MGIPSKYDDALKFNSQASFTDTPRQPDDNNEPVFCILCGIIEGQSNLTSSEGMKGAIQVTLFVGRFCINLQVGSLFLNHSSSQIDASVHYSRWVLYDSSFIFILYFFHWHLRMR